MGHFLINYDKDIPIICLLWDSYYVRFDKVIGYIESKRLDSLKTGMIAKLSLRDCVLNSNLHLTKT